MELKLSRRFLINNAMMLVPLVGVTGFGVLADTGFYGPIATMGTLGCAACAFGLLWSAHKYESTRLSEAGVEQATMKGRVFVRWTEVKEMRMYSKAFILESPGGTVLVYPKAYNDPEDVSEYVVTRMRKVMQERGAQVAENDTKFY
jgi:hypothetical protein